MELSNLTYELKYLVISDIHLGNHRNPTLRILRNLEDYLLLDSKPTYNLDIIFIAGDFFDKALQFSQEDIFYINRFILKLFDYCEKYRIKLRYLEGTPSHDRNQFRNFSPFLPRFPQLDYRYIETMCIEVFEDLGITCLYVPDEHEHGGESSQRVIDRYFQDNHIEKVDITIMHSWFKYQVPEVASKTKYDEAFFLDRTRYFINNGHIHTPSTYERIVGQGSFDRMAHNEEHPKGGTLMTISPEGMHYLFIENKQALPFITLTLKSKDIDVCLKYIDKKVKDLDELAWVRIKAEEGHPFLQSLEVLKEKYPYLRFEKKALDSIQERLVNENAFMTLDYKPIELHKGNIVSMILSRVEVQDTSRLETILESFV